MTATGDGAVPVVDVRRLVKRIWDGRTRRTLLDDVSFQVGQGDMIVVRGSSGSGKTTLLALVGGMLTPTSGEVLLEGVSITRLREAHRAELRRSRVGFVFQDVQLIPALTALDNVLLPSVPDGLLRSAHMERARALLSRFGIADVGHVRAGALSGGERQRVALARALLLSPRLLVLDEPTAHLDDERASDLVVLLSSLRAEGRSVLVATHDPRLSKPDGVTRVLELAAARLVEHA